MPKRSSKKNPASETVPDPVQLTPEGAPPDGTGGKNPAAVQLGRLGGKKGGPARAKKLTAERRREIAKKAAAARWAKRDGEG